VWVIKPNFHHNNNPCFALASNNALKISKSNKIKHHSILICEPKILKIRFAKKPTFENWPSWMHHEINASTHANGAM